MDAVPGGLLLGSGTLAIHDSRALTRFGTAIEAHLLCTCLQSAGLDATVRDGHAISMDWLISNAIGGVKVQVPLELTGRCQREHHHPTSRGCRHRVNTSNGMAAAIAS